MSLDSHGGRELHSHQARPFSDAASPSRTLCSCCPYGYHIDTDFIRYCETLISELNQCTNSSSRYRSPSHVGSYANHRAAPIDDSDRMQETLFPNERVPSNFHRSNSLQYRRRPPMYQRSSSVERSHQSYFDHDYMNGNYLGRYSDNEQPYPRPTHNTYNRHSPMIPSAINQPPAMSQSYHHHYPQEDIGRRPISIGVNKSHSSSTIPRYLNGWPLPPSPSAKYDHDANTWYEAVRRFDQVCLEHQESLRRRMKRRIGGMNSNGPTLGSLLSSTASTLSPSVPSSSSDTASIKSSKSQGSSSFDSHVPPPPPAPASLDLNFSQSMAKSRSPQPSKPHSSITPTLTTSALSLAAATSSTTSGIGASSRYSPKVCNAIIQEIHTQIQSNMERVKELENQVKAIPLLKQQLILATKEKKNMEKLLTGGQASSKEPPEKPIDLAVDAQNREEFNSRIAHLERSGLITPPLSRRKNLLIPCDLSDDEHDGAMSDRMNYDAKIDEYFADAWQNIHFSPSPIASTPIEGRSSAITAKSIITPVKPHLTSSSSVGPDSRAETVKRRLSLQSVESVTIEPKPLSRLSVASDAARRSVGVSTHSSTTFNALHRRHASVGTDLHGDDIVSRKELNCEKRPMISWGTDPIPINCKHAWIQVSPSRTSVGLKTDAVPTKSTGINPAPILDDTKEVMTQTERVIMRDKQIQSDVPVSSIISREFRTIGTGDESVSALAEEKQTESSLTQTDREHHAEVHTQTGQRSPRPSSVTSFSMVLCDKCNEKVPISPEDQSSLQPQQARPSSLGDSCDSPSSPASRIPRLSTPTQGVSKSNSGSGMVEKRLSADRKLVIQEKENEILVYSNLGLDLDEDVDDLEEERTEKLCPPPIRPKRKEYNQADIDKICSLISDSDGSNDDEDDDESKDSSSDEGTYDVARAKHKAEIAAQRQVTEAIKEAQEPSKEMRAGLKVLNDHLIRPERQSKSSIVSLDWVPNSPNARFLILGMIF